MPCLWPLPSLLGPEELPPLGFPALAETRKEQWSSKGICCAPGLRNHTFLPSGTASGPSWRWRALPALLHHPPLAVELFHSIYDWNQLQVMSLSRQSWAHPLPAGTFRTAFSGDQLLRADPQAFG